MESETVGLKKFEVFFLRCETLINTNLLDTRILTTAIQDNGRNVSMLVVKNHTLNT